MVNLNTTAWYMAVYNRSDLSPEEELLGESQIAAIGIVFAFILACGTVSNMLVVITLVLNTKMRQQMNNVLLLSLAVADLVFLWCCIPVTIGMYAEGYWTNGLVLCKLMLFSMHVAGIGSAYTMVLLSVDRYVAVMLPIHSRRWRTPVLASVLVSCVWIITALCSAKLLWEYELKDIDGEKVICIHSSKIKVTYHIIFCITQYVVPLLVITVLYVILLRKLRMDARAKTIKRQSLRLVLPVRMINEPTGLTIIDRSRRVTFMVVGVITAFALCWFPLQLRLVLHALDADTPLWFRLLGQGMIYFNSAINPLLYAFLSDNFRQGFKAVLRCSLGSYLHRVREMMDEEVLEAALRCLIPNAECERTLTAAGEVAVDTQMDGRSDLQPCSAAIALQIERSAFAQGEQANTEEMVKLVTKKNGEASPNLLTVDDARREHRP